MKRVLITGGAGFIGSNFVRSFLQAEPDVTVTNLDALTYAGSLENLVNLPDDKRHRFVQGDIRDQDLVESLLRDHDIDTVVNFAAESHVDRSIDSPAPFLDTNIFGTFSLLESARSVWGESADTETTPKRFLHVSTDEVYGSLDADEPAFTEKTAYRPNSPYAASKAASDHMVRAYGHTYGLPVLVTNCSNNYGPFQFPEKLIPLMILNALEGKPLPIYGDGSNIRDWLYVEDHCRAIGQVLRAGRLGETYNIGGHNQPTNLMLVHQLCQILNEEIPDSPYAPHEELIEFVTDRPGHDHRYAMDTTKIESELGWRPSEDLSSGLRKTVHWYLDHPDWVASIHKRPSYQEWIQHNYSDRTTAT
ncbi:MAG: dTDP-glucose 4,6-dehydratase [Anaerolineales bacterium]